MIADTYGYYEAIWRKAGVHHNISAKLREQVSETNAVAGTNILDTVAVATNEIWLIDYISCYNFNNAVTGMRIFLVGVPGLFALRWEGALAASTVITINGPFHLYSGEKVRVNFFGCVAGDDLIVNVFGYKMVLSE